MVKSLRFIQPRNFVVLCGVLVLGITAAVWATRYNSAGKMPPGANFGPPVTSPHADPALNKDIEFLRLDLARRAVWGEPEVQMLIDYAARESPYARRKFVLEIDPAYSWDDVAQDLISIDATLIVADRLFRQHKIDDSAGPRCVKILLDQITSPKPGARQLSCQLVTNETGLVQIPQVRELLLTLRADHDPLVAANVDNQLRNFDKHVAAGLVKPLPPHLVRWTTEALKMK